jgi:hypothetical protein
MRLVSPSSRGERQLLDESLIYLGRGGQAMSAFKIPQRLLGGGALFPVRLDRVAKFGQGGLGGQGQTRGVAVGFPGQEIRDRIGRRGGALGGVGWPRRRNSRGGLRGRSGVYRAGALWGGGLGWRGSGGGLRRRESEQRGGMALALQEKRVDANADKSDRQGRCEIVSQMRDLHAPGDPSSQRFLSGTLDGPSELANVVSYACKR